MTLLIALTYLELQEILRLKNQKKRNSMLNFKDKRMDIESNLKNFQTYYNKEKRHLRSEIILFSSQIITILLLNEKNTEKDKR